MSAGAVDEQLKQYRALQEGKSIDSFAQTGCLCVKYRSIDPPTHSHTRSD